MPEHTFIAVAAKSEELHVRFDRQWCSTGGCRTLRNRWASTASQMGQQITQGRYRPSSSLLLPPYRPAALPGDLLLTVTTVHARNSVCFRAANPIYLEWCTGVCGSRMGLLSCRVHGRSHPQLVRVAVRCRGTALWLQGGLYDC